jgi:hypothetical protein
LGIFVCTFGRGPGLIDHNTFSGSTASEMIHVFGSGITWPDDVVPGSANMIFIENNTFTNICNVSSCNDGTAEEAFNDAVLVFRYNTLNMAGMDVHNGSNGGRWIEAYQNTFNIHNDNWHLSGYMQFRGGSGVFFSNHSSGSPCCQDPFPGMSIGPNCPGSSDTCSGTYPIVRQVGRGINTITYSPAYAWGNDSAIQSRIGSSGNQPFVLVGTAPTDAANCSGHPGNVCDAIVTANQPASLELCQSAADLIAGCPVSFTYTPFTYPHPLDIMTGSASSPTINCTKADKACP